MLKINHVEFFKSVKTDKRKKGNEWLNEELTIKIETTCFFLCVFIHMYALQYTYIYYLNLQNSWIMIFYMFGKICYDCTDMDTIWFLILIIWQEVRCIEVQLTVQRTHMFKKYIRIGFMVRFTVQCKCKGRNMSFYSLRNV